MPSSYQAADSPAAYEIRLKGYLPTYWSDWFDDMDVTHDDEGNTRLTGPIADQAALHGVLNKIRDLGLVLLSVRALSSSRVQETEERGA